jgi:hypothetical protein
VTLLAVLLIVGCGGALRYRVKLEDQSFQVFDKKTDYVLLQYAMVENSNLKIVRADTIESVGDVMLGPLSPDTTYRFIFTRRQYGKDDAPAISCVMSQRVVFYSDLKQWKPALLEPLKMNEYDCLSLKDDTLFIDPNVVDTSLKREEGTGAF